MNFIQVNLYLFKAGCNYCMKAKTEFVKLILGLGLVFTSFILFDIESKEVESSVILFASTFEYV